MPSAVVWSNVGGTGLFNQLGKIVKWINLLDAAEKSALTDPLLALDASFVRGIPEQMEMASQFASTSSRWYSSLRSYKNNIKALVTGVLRYHLSVFGPDTSNMSESELLDLLHEAMIADVQTINASTLAIGLPTVTTTRRDGTANLGNASLQGQFSFIPPGVVAHFEGFWADVYEALCTSGYAETTSNLNTLQVANTDEPQADKEFSSKSGSAFFPYGDMTSLTVQDETTAISANGGFEEFDVVGNPSDWEVGAWAGAPTSVPISPTDYSQESVVFYRDSYSLKVVPAPATKAIHQVVQVSSGNTYALFMRVRKAATGTSFNLTASVITSNAVALGTLTVLDSDLAAADTWYAKAVFFRVSPAVDLTEVFLNFNWAGSWSSVYIDDLFLLPVTQSNGIDLVAVAGTLPLYKNDRLTFTTTNNYAGVFQTFFGRFFQRSLPSNNAAGETILDSLAT